MDEYESSGSEASDVELDGGDCEKYTCLVCDHESSASSDFFTHLSEKHNWNLKEEPSLFKDQYVWIAFVNWARAKTSNNWRDFLTVSTDEHQKYLQPVLPDDEVLMIDVESVSGNSEDEAMPNESSENKSVEQLRDENFELQVQLSKCRYVSRYLISDFILPHPSNYTAFLSGK